jgi:murein DD-endopeptidase MepM/ murein hydrolase activator NlpD
MTPVAFSGQTGAVSRIRNMFRDRDVFFHDGQTMKRFTLTSRMQVSAVAVAGIAALTSVAGALGLVIAAPSVSSTISDFAAKTGEVRAMEYKVAALQAEVDGIRNDARAHVKRLEARHNVLASLIKDEATAATLAAYAPAFGRDAGNSEAHILFGGVEASQREVASLALRVTEARYRKIASALAGLGINPDRVQLAMGGPYEPVVPANPAEAQSAANPVPTAKADPQFKALFNSWKRLDQLQQGMISIPSVKPVNDVTINSGFGVRSDPFRGGRAMHAGVDIPGPIGTPIYATADGVVGRSGWVSGYGKLVELEHGRGIQTRYGHMSSISVPAGTRVKRGQLIGLMGSTGRSTGSHLHYEVRIDGRAVNPLPFLRSNDYLIAMQARTQAPATALGGPNKGE